METSSDNCSRLVDNRRRSHGVQNTLAPMHRVQFPPSSPPSPSFPPVFSMPIQMADRPPRFVRLTRAREKASIVTLNSKVDEGRESRGFGNLTNRRWKIRGFKNLVIWKIETSYTRLEIVANSTIFYSRA